MANTTNVESRKLEDRPLGQEESRRKNVADTANVESRESEGRPQDKEESRRKNVADTMNVESRESGGTDLTKEESRKVVRAEPQYHGKLVWKASRNRGEDLYHEKKTDQGDSRRAK